MYIWNIIIYYIILGLIYIIYAVINCVCINLFDLTSN